MQEFFLQEVILRRFLRKRRSCWQKKMQNAVSCLHQPLNLVDSSSLRPAVLRRLSSVQKPHLRNSGTFSMLSKLAHLILLLCLLNTMILMNKVKSSLLFHALEILGVLEHAQIQVQVL
jgi:hypothetical protein